jgi:hypothetical protein
MIERGGHQKEHKVAGGIFFIGIINNKKCPSAIRTPSVLPSNHFF